MNECRRCSRPTMEYVVPLEAERLCPKCMLIAIRAAQAQLDKRTAREWWADEYRNRRRAINKTCRWCAKRKVLRGMGWCGPCKVLHGPKLRQANAEIRARLMSDPAVIRDDAQ